MANIYVSQTEINGYGVGLDTRDRATAASKTTPVLTITRALSVAQAGDAIVINDGTYVESAYLRPTVNVTINPENAYLVTVQTPDTTRVIYQDCASLTIGKIILDADYVASYVLQQRNSDITDLTLQGTKLINFKAIGIKSDAAVNITMSDGWLIDSQSTVTVLYGIMVKCASAGIVSISDGKLNLYAPNGSSSVVAIDLTALVTGCNLEVKDIEITVGSGSGAGAVAGIKAIGFTEYDINNNEITETSLQTTGSYTGGIYIPNSSIPCSKCWIYENTINGGNPNPDSNASGINIAIGDDSNSQPTNHDNINGVWVHDNTCNNMNHQILLGWITNGVVQGNRCSNGVIGVIGKMTTNCLFSGNELIDIRSGGSLRAKGATGDIFCNNTIIMTSVCLTSGMAIQADLASSGVKFSNNIIYMDDIGAICVSVQDTSEATFKSNDYYIIGRYASSPFRYGATNYADLAAWIAAKESTALNIDPEFVDYSNADYRVPASNSDLYHAGVYASANARDYKGRPFHVKPTIGAYEVANGDTCLTRTART